MTAKPSSAAPLTRINFIVPPQIPRSCSAVRRHSQNPSRLLLDYTRELGQLMRQENLPPNHARRNNREDLATHPTPDSAKRNLAATGVMLVIFLFAIDATIVSTSMPTIVAKLGGLELYSWVFSIYMLTSALTTPIFGKLADLFSKRRLMLIGIGDFSPRLDAVRRGPEHGGDDRLSRHSGSRRRRDLRACRSSSSA